MSHVLFYLYSSGFDKSWLRCPADVSGLLVNPVSFCFASIFPPPGGRGWGGKGGEGWWALIFTYIMRSFPGITNTYKSDLPVINLILFFSKIPRIGVSHENGACHDNAPSPRYIYTKQICHLTRINAKTFGNALEPSP